MCNIHTLFYVICLVGSRLRSPRGSLDTAYQNSDHLKLTCTRRSSEARHVEHVPWRRPHRPELAGGRRRQRRRSSVAGDEGGLGLGFGMGGNATGVSQTGSVRPNPVVFGVPLDLGAFRTFSKSFETK
jgi:hypothetical protein